MANENEKVKEIAENISKDLVRPLQNDYFKMYKKSEWFLKELQKIVNRYTEKTNNDKTYKNLKKEIYDLYKLESDDKDRKLESEIGALQAKFSSQIDKFLGRQIILTIIDENGNILLTDTKQEAYIMGNLSRSAFKDSGRGRININKGPSRDMDDEKGNKKISLNEINKKMAKSKDANVKKLQTAINESAKTKKEVFKTAILRFNKDKKMYYYYDIQSKEQSKKLYGTGKKTSIADITEKYTIAVVNNDEKINSNGETATKEYSNSIDNSLQHLYVEYIASSKHDSIPALTKGDIKITQEGTFQLAVKYKSSHTALVGQYINFAKFIVGSGPDGNISAKDLTDEILSKIARKRNIDIEKMGDDKAFTFLKDIKLTT